jgi:hypothetical protein
MYVVRQKMREGLFLPNNIQHLIRHLLRSLNEKTSPSELLIIDHTEALDYSREIAYNLWETIQSETYLQVLRLDKVGVKNYGMFLL